MVTGASEGLGKSLAIELASQGIDLVIVSLPDSGLHQLASYIRKNFDVQVHCFEADLTLNESCQNLFAFLKAYKLRISILVNNAGIGNWSMFAERNTGFYKKQIELNVMAPVLLTRLFLDQLEPFEPAHVLNVGSLGGLFVVPGKPVYGATKSFIRYFTQCLRLELSKSNVRVSLLSAGGINTKPELLVMNHNLKGLSRAAVLEPEQVAKAAIRGMFKGRKEIIPGSFNRLLVLLNQLLPAGVKEYIIRRKLGSVRS
jgi:short-subunit dehydrogenase